MPSFLRDPYYIHRFVERHPKSKLVIYYRIMTRLQFNPVHPINSKE